jgi:signal transduction histidine kinase
MSDDMGQAIPKSSNRNSCLQAAARNRLELTLLNLVMNARDAMPSGGTIHITAQMLEAYSGNMMRSYLQVRVKEGGLGMDEHTLAKSSELFFTTKPVGKGTGMGLWIVRKFVSELGGRFSLMSMPGFGTTAELRIPVTEIGSKTGDFPCHR